MKINDVLLAAAALSLGAAMPAVAADLSITLPDEPGFSIRGGLGILVLEAKEMVWQDSGTFDPLSRLVWQSTAPMAYAGIEGRLPDGWTVSAKARVAVGGDSYMEDYDWIPPYITGYGPGDWSDRSQHDDTNLESYFSGSVLVGRDFALRGGVTANVNLGLQYTDVQWAAYGGSYVYSIGGFRNAIGDFADGDPAISYHQQLPAVIAGIDLGFEEDRWSLNVSGHGGVSFAATSTDNHWMRDLVITDSFNPAPLLSLEGRVAYALTDNMAIELGGSVEQIFMMRGDADYDNTGTINDFTYADGAGADLFSASMTTGLKGTF